MGVIEGAKGFFPKPAAIGFEPGLDDEAAWARFAGAPTGAAYFAAWLDLQARLTGIARAGLLLIEGADGSALAPVAIWPDAGRDLTYLKAVAEEAVAERRGVVRPEEGELPGTRIAYPVEQDGHLFGLVVFDLDTRDDALVQRILRKLHWGSGWLDAEIRRHRAGEAQLKLDRAVFALDILAVAGEHAKLEAAAMALVNALATGLDCDRVSCGLVHGGARGSPILKLAAISHTAWFRRKAALSRDLENAMEEALDQGTTVAAPAIPGIERAIAVAHAGFLEEQRAGAIASVVMLDRGRSVGVLTLERKPERRIDAETVRMAEAVAALVGPMLDLKRRQRRWIAGRLPDAIGEGVRTVLGPQRPSLKLAALAALAALAFLAFDRSTFAVSAGAVLEGTEQRAAVAPFNGYVAEAPFRAGDMVKAGDVVARLDDNDLRLDVQRWRSEYAKLVQERRRAQAGFDRAEVALLDAQIEQARAQLDLTAAKLERAEITAPIDGIVISGDLSQSLGAPVQQGEVLFEIAPLDAYRVILKVDERDIRYVSPRQTGHLLLSGRADEALAFSVVRMTSVASVEEGRNLFRVEARLDEEASAIRPGMEGVGKVEIGEARTIWIWSRRLLDWASLFVWRWTP